jgi:hypothetical protein
MYQLNVIHVKNQLKFELLSTTVSAIHFLQHTQLSIAHNYLNIVNENAC